MHITDAKALALSMMREHGLTDWHFKYDAARRRLGLTQYKTKTISLSKNLTLLNPESQIRNTILHEIAHALVGHGHGHNNVWRSKAISIGCNGQRTTDSIVKVKPAYTIQCLHCNRSWGTFRRPKSLRNMWHSKCGRVSINRLVTI